MKYVENLREPKSDVDPFDLDEALRIIEAARGSDRTFLSVLLFTGLRPDEALAGPAYHGSLDRMHGARTFLRMIRTFFV